MPEELTDEDINEIYQMLMMSKKAGNTRMSIDADTLEQLVVHWEQTHVNVANVDLDEFTD